MHAAFGLIESCLANKEFEDAEHYARHAMFMINDMADNFIPSDQRTKFLAEASYYLARAIYELARSGGIPPERKQKEGEEAIALARQALKLHTQLHGTTDSGKVANIMSVLANVIAYFSKVDDDDEVPRLYEQSIAIFCQVEGSSSLNVAACEGQLGNAYSDRANRAANVNDLDRCMINMELSLPRYVEAARIYRAINHIDSADMALRDVARVEKNIRRIRIARAAASRK
jgi:tetratricopeptide (TPR) repeat protein